MRELLTNKYFVVGVMAVIVFIATQFIKLPIKHFTSKIKDERKRRMANATILLIPFILGVALDILYSKFITCEEISIISSAVRGLGYGMAGISLYGIIERFFKVKIENPYETEEGEAVTEMVETITADKKIDKKDADPVKDFWKKVK